MRPDTEVIVSVLRGDVGAFAELVDRHQRTVCAVAAAVLGDLHLAEDAAQEAFVAAFQHLAELRDHAAFATWLLQITRRQALRIKSKQVAGAPLDEPKEQAAPSANGQLGERKSALLELVMRLPQHERFVVALHHLGGHSVRDVADMTGRPVGTVTKQLSRAYERLRQTVTETSQ